MTTVLSELEHLATGQETPDRGPDDLNAAMSRHLIKGHQANGFGTSREAPEVPAEQPEPRFRLDLPLRHEHEFEGIIGCCSSLRQVVEQVKMVSPTNSTVLLLGETGTGKELVARAVSPMLVPIVRYRFSEFIVRVRQISPKRSFHLRGNLQVGGTTLWKTFGLAGIATGVFARRRGPRMHITFNDKLFKGCEGAPWAAGITYAKSHHTKNNHLT